MAEKLALEVGPEQTVELEDRWQVASDQEAVCGAVWMT